jgi:hypothetical protein
VRSYFDDVTRERVPEALTALARRLDAEPGQGSREDGDHHGPSTIETSDRVDRRR